MDPYEFENTLKFNVLLKLKKQLPTHFYKRPYFSSFRIQLQFRRTHSKLNLLFGLNSQARDNARFASLQLSRDHRKFADVRQWVNILRRTVSKSVAHLTENQPDLHIL